ncbi:MAG: T9SS type A sorting domain-containing protein [Bacteroidales bacterium]|nr:T9SS type A sorting domain-containing protein [Bacteroidales bacterium]
MKKILFSIIFLLSLLTVKSQDNLVVTIDGTVGELRATTSKNVPVFCSNKWAISQQFYFAEEICKAHGTIESIAFKTAEVTEETEKYPFTRNLIVYIINTEEYAVAGNIMKSMSESDQVFSGEVEFSYNSWVTIDIEDFEYTGKNILICVNDISGTNVSGGVTFDAFIGPIMVGENNGYRALFKRSISGAFNATTSISGASTILDTPVPCVRLTFKEGSTEEYLDPAQPTNFTATVLNESEVLLEWTGDENTSSYDICENAEVIANTTETSFVVKNLSFGWHCFKIIGVNGIKKSEPSEIQCVELIKGPEGPEESIEELTSSLLLYPNPVNDRLYIETQTLTLTQTPSIEIYDIYGRRQLTETSSHQGNLSVDVTDLNSGVYFVKIVTSESETVKRIIKN